jgi:hypothetical protein
MLLLGASAQLKLQDLIVVQISNGLDLRKITILVNDNVIIDGSIKSFPPSKQSA